MTSISELRENQLVLTQKRLHRLEDQMQQQQEAAMLERLTSEKSKDDQKQGAKRSFLKRKESASSVKQASEVSSLLE